MKYTIVLLVIMGIACQQPTELVVPTTPKEESTRIPLVDDFMYCPQENVEEAGVCFGWNVFRQVWKQDRIEAKEGEVVYRLILQGYMWTPLVYRQLVLSDNIATISIHAYDQLSENMVYNKRWFDTLFTINRDEIVLDSLEDLVEQTQLYDIPAGADYRFRGGDGEDYVLEISKGGVNRVWVRWSPDMAMERLGKYTNVEELGNFLKVVRMVERICTSKRDQI